MSNTRALRPAVKPLWASLCSTPPKRHLDPSSVVLIFGPIVGGDKRKRASDRRKSLSITLFPRCLTGRQRGGRGGASGAEEAICSVLEEGRGERELIRPRGSPRWTTEFSEGSDPGGAAGHQSCFGNQEAEGRMETTACTLHYPLHHCRWGSNAINLHCKLMKSFINCHLSLLLPNKYEPMILRNENDVRGLTLHN